MEIRQLTKEDLPQVLVVQKDSYPPPLLESEDCFARKLALSPDSCLGVFEHHQLIGYLFTHPWISGEVVSLNDTTTWVPHTANCIYIHDLAVLRSHRKHGIGHLLVKRILQMAGSRNHQSLALVAVNRSEAFWERYGFRRHSTITYGEGITATYMVRRSGPG
jgi:GNAT superfamily N-acetyltransferase